MSFTSSSDDQQADGFVVNKQELAEILGRSRQSIDDLLKRYPDFPVAHKGRNGREYQFDAIAARAFVEAKQAEAEKAEADRRERIAQLALPLAEIVSAGVSPLSPRDEKAHWESQARRDAVFRTRRELILVSDEMARLTDALSRWNRMLHAAIKQAGRDMNLPDSVVRVLIDVTDEQQRALERDLKIAAAGGPKPV